MAVISNEIEVDAPAGTVWDVLADIRRLPEFSSSTVAVTGAPPCLRERGEQFTQVVKSLGRRWESQWTVVDIEPGRRLSSEGSVAPGVRLRLTEQVEPRGESRCALRMEFDYQVPGGPLGRLAAKAGLEARARTEAREVLDGVRVAAEQRATTRS